MEPSAPPPPHRPAAILEHLEAGLVERPLPVRLALLAAGVSWADTSFNFALTSGDYPGFRALLTRAYPTRLTGPYL